MTAKPTESILWAESAAGGDVSDPSAKRSAGYQFEDPWPHEEANYMFRAIGRFANWIGRSAGLFSSPQGATTATGVGALAAGETLITGQGGGVSSGTPPGTATTRGPTITEATVDCDHDGYFLVVLEQGDGAVVESSVHVYDDSGLVATRSWDTGYVAADAQAIACNGEYIAVLRSGGEIELYDYDGVSQWTGDRNATSSDICMDQTRVYACGAAGTATGGSNSREVQAWLIADGSLDWELDTAHTASLLAIATEGNVVLAGGSAGGGGAHLLKLAAGTGVTDDSAVLTNAIADKGRIAFGPCSAYVATTTGGISTLREIHYQGALGELAGVCTLTGTMEGGVSVDDRFVYVISNNRLHAVPSTRALESRWLGFNIASGGNGHVTTGQFLFVLDDDAGDIKRVSTGRRYGVWEYTGDTPYSGHWFQRRFIPGD